MAFDFLALAFGLVVLCAGTEIAIRGAVKIAHGLKLSPILIGLTLVAFGTDLPELFVAIRGALEILSGTDTSGIIVGNAVGSSICQISLVMGVVALLFPGQNLKRHLSFLAIPLLSAVVLLFLAGLDGTVGRIEGMLLIIGFLAYLVTTFLRRKDGHDDEELFPPVPGHRRQLWVASLLLIAGLSTVVLSTELVLDKALKIAEAWGVGQSFVGSVIVAVGTSMPELAISFGAAYRKQTGLSVGNVIGSNIFDCLVPVGLAGMISRVQVEYSILFLDLPILLLVSAMLIWFLRKDRRLSRLQGLCFCLIFVGYVVGKFFSTPAH